MKDKLSYSQLYTELETLNTSVFDCLLNEDFESFQNIINEFVSSGIMEQEEFAKAREAYRYSSMPFTLDGIWVGVDSRNPLNEAIIANYGPSIQDIAKRDVWPTYTYMTQQKKISSNAGNMTKNRTSALDEYIKLYEDLYSSSTSQNILKFLLIDDPEKHKMFYINKVTALAAARSRSYTTFDFKTLNTNGIKFIEMEKLRNMELPERIDYLTKSFTDIFDHRINKNRYTIKDCFAFSGYEKVLASNYLQGKDIDRKNWKNYTIGKLPKNPMFYLQLAFYLTIPSSAEIEKFMSLHGYSIKSPMTLFKTIEDKKNDKKYHILHRDLCRWIDAGLDYNLLNEMLGFKPEIKEIRKPKA